MTNLPLTTARQQLFILGGALEPSITALLPSITAEQLLHHEATLLFIARAKAARASFAVTDHNASAVAQVCRRLDGMPLALELAAARLKSLSVEQVAQRIRGNSHDL